MHQYWFWIGNFPVRAYSTIFAAAFLIGLGVTLYFAKADGKRAYIPHLWNMAPWLLIGGLVGSRFWQVFFFDWPYYSKNPGQIPMIWHGGLSIQGGIAGALVVSIYYLWRHGINFWSFADITAPGLLLAQSIGRDANLMNGDAFGDPTHQDFGLLYPPGTLAHATFGNQPLWPAEVWEGQADVILFGLLLILKQRRWPSGFLFMYYVVAYNAVRFCLEMLRGDSPRFALNWDAAQWTSAPVVVAGVIITIYLFVRDRKRRNGDGATGGGASEGETDGVTPVLPSDTDPADRP
ncbi:prolipoprotein diacylglyceryl transferase [Alicyclobacillus cycloheptanicus]|uniref:Phosphatidylglycerol--prolipoprotein diacylglyceryl transferase n=1 Tax=Alicyclobacillus cycloheptanicus TaxID=1457 RepID=A0ABT9XD57_9BACL|nr:prolipoprotein diacylglyceryl transferase [Alicyclobacillus cycloheptanicus]MDQ0188232.1 phosphatidylglycerol:prolipoprotein diacylglycerol transferase [Alicyclobacillus cycloheptanicus]WDM00960.1 prolipoprotein diacylglyceryl transferase [Alicyclobacillus cycloheptanicus]